MNLQDYLDPGRFPLTTQAGLAPTQQLMLDAFKYDGMEEEREYRKDLDEHWHAVWAELQVKAPHIARLAAEVAAAEARER